MEQLEARLKDILRKKKELSPDVWMTEYLLHSAFQNMLLSTFTTLVSNNKKNVLPIMKEILTEYEMSQIDENKFLALKNLHHLLYDIVEKEKYIKVEDITDIATLISFVKQYTNETSHEDPDSQNEFLGTEMKKAIDGFFSKCEQAYDKSFVFVLIIPFLKQGEPENILFQPLNFKNLQLLYNKLSEEVNQYKSYHEWPVCLQSYIVLLLLDSIHEKELPVQIYYTKKVSQTIESCQLLDNTVSLALNEYLQTNNLFDFKQKLRRNLISKPKLSVSSTAIQEIPCISTKHPDYANGHAVMVKLGLEKFSSKRLQFQDALRIRSTLLKPYFKISLIDNLSQLPFMVLHRLLSYDSSCRADFLTALTSSSCFNDCNEDYGDAEYEDDNCEDLNDAASDVINPLDCLLAVLICADDFLRQDLIARLEKCQIAVPFILPDPFRKELVIPLWALRTIIKDLCLSDHPHLKNSVCMVDHPMPFISIIRCGEPEKQGYSKSRLMNLIISDDGLDRFFHRHCSGGQYKSVLVDGLVDMCWYIPKYCTESDIFTDTLAFLNLHGDARNHYDQIDFLCRISFIVVIMLHEINMNFNELFLSQLKKVESCHGSLIFLNGVTQNHTELRQRFPKAFWVNLPRKTDAEVKGMIRKRIRHQLKQKNIIYSLTKACQSPPEVFKVDEHSIVQKEGIKHTEKVMSLIKSESLSKDCKESMFPLQGKNMWMAWALEDKELYRQKSIGYNETIENYTEKIKKKKLILRKQQLQHVEQLAPVMEKFIISLKELGKSSDSNLIHYFLKNLRLNLDTLSRKLVSEYQQKYREIQLELSKHEVNEPAINIQEIESLKFNLVILQEQILDSSLCLEDFFRELGQLYEAAEQTQESMNNYISFLPKIAAELFINGYPLEIMDGRASHVPLKWVTAVLTETGKILGNPNVFVLSVLGIQSSGKSTMLNTTFGLQFKVTSGRCTRGAFVQLLKLNEDLKAQNKCDYILVVDTEGLRALSVDPLKAQKQDNELATFVIGLANMTLINVKGEVPGDIDNILQTSVHAFLRMDMVKYHPSCQFVYQNASSNIQTQVERALFAKKLNIFTVNAAKEEHCEDLYKEFKQVIKFDDQTDVHYFPGLWKGDPPMGQINPGYSHVAQKLKYELFCERKSNGSNLMDLPYIDFTSFQTKISDVWNSLLKENFVFSFKNTLEIVAYNSLETQFSLWDVKFRSTMLEWELQAENEINTEPPDSVETKVQQKIKELTIFVTGTLEPLKLAMDNHFQGPQKEILLQWKKRYEYKLQSVANDVQRNAEEQCNNILQRKKVSKEIERARKETVKYMKSNVQHYIDVMKEQQLMLQESINKREVSLEQLEKLKSMDLFCKKKMGRYIKKGIISTEDVAKIESHRINGKEYTEHSLNCILQSGMLSADQVHMILKDQKQTEKYLEDKFNEIWQNLLTKCPRVKPKPDLYIYNEVQKSLLDFAAGHGSQVIKKVQEANRLPRTKLEFKPKKGVHYHENIVPNGDKNDPQNIAKQITAAVFEKAQLYITKIEKKKTGFKSVYTTELLQLTRETIERHSDESCITFTPKYNLEMYLKVIGFAYVKFEEIDKSFEEQNDPIVYIEKHVRGPLFTKFKNQYQETEAEECIADYLSAQLKQPIIDQVELKLASIMIQNMKTSEYYFANKKALKIKILIDLYHNNNFELYLDYFKKFEESLENHIEKYTIAYCDKKADDSDLTRLQSSACDQVIQLVYKVQEVINEMDAFDISEWLNNFNSDKCIRSELGISIDPEALLEDVKTLNKFNLENFQIRLKSEVKNIKEAILNKFNKITFESIQWQDKPHIMLKSLVGCTAQCPFCGEQCELLEHEEAVDHRTEIHRIDCLIGWSISNTRRLTTDLCPAILTTDMKFKVPGGHQEYEFYRDYKKVYKNWSIQPDVTSKSCSYWKWFVSKYKDDLALRYHVEPAETPPEWKQITWQEIKEDLKDAYNIDIDKIEQSS